MTSRFVSAAELMARVLGFAGYGFAVIPHPISSAGDAGLLRAAEAAAVQVTALLVREGEARGEGQADTVR